MTKIKVKKLSSNENTYRTRVDEFDFMPFPPEVGRPLILLSSALGPSGGIYTSNVQALEKEGSKITITTLNSIYEIEVLEEA